jgi:uncharacterized membrane protein YwaF
MQLWLYYAISVIVVWGLIIAHRNASDRQRHRTLMILAVINAIAYVVNWWYFYIRSDHILTLLPLQLCNLAVFLIPAALITRKGVLMDFVFYVCGLGALVAILIPGSDYADTYSMMTISFYVFHFSIFLIPVLAAVWGIHSLKPTRKSAFDLSLMVLVISLTLHGVNLILNVYFDVPANYFFTMRELAAPINPAFAFFASLIPVDYLYLSFAFPILWLYMALIGGLMRALKGISNT